MSYRCLICNAILESPHGLEVHLQVEHKWKQKKAPTGHDTWT